MADNPVDLSAGDIGKLSPIDQARLIEELRLSRQLLGRQSESQNRSPHLPPFSGDTTKGFVYSYWKDLITSLSLSYSDVSLIQAIRKAVSGQPAQIIGRLQVNCTLNDIFTALDTAYEAIHDEPAAWQLFYSVKQSRSESVVEWHTRLCSVWARIPDPGDVGLKIKKRLWTGLYSDATKESSRHQYDNDDVTEITLVKYLRQIEESKTSPKLSTNTVQAEDLQGQITMLASRLDSLAFKGKNTDKNGECRNDREHRRDTISPNQPPYAHERNRGRNYQYSDGFQYRNDYNQSIPQHQLYPQRHSYNLPHEHIFREHSPRYNPRNYSSNQSYGRPKHPLN